ncbi:hypothetical protein CHS0354_002646 [Potamilus streckersoni]|uniref:Uncharacterized protein n=1 Tax=Potamilus streckersoni TaxID=2493646 RepID=A0AAE0RNQ2_9BIVA|nr:hypothetical protein CHS0354_002646 [Potamilus streckersoni]
MKTLLFPLKITGLQSLQKFTDVLRETNHRWIAEVLLETDNDSENSAEFESDLNEHLFGPVSKLTFPPTTRNSFAKHLDRTLKLTGTGYSNHIRIGEGEYGKGSILSCVPEELRDKIEQKEKALSEIQIRMKDIKEQFANLYRPAPNERDSFDRLIRLRALQMSTRY